MHKICVLELDILFVQAHRDRIPNSNLDSEDDGAPLGDSFISSVGVIHLFPLGYSKKLIGEIPPFSLNSH